ncbi:MAG: TlpA family protein disulfide reductase [Acidobacteriota bacterium]|nr:TlpA family protein disulfide reductase [Acidobacteriota bacterium]
MSDRKARRAQQLAARREAKRAAKHSPGRSRWQSSRREWWLAGISVVVAGIVIAGIVVARGGGGAQPAPAASAAKGVLHISGTDPTTGKRVSLDAYAGKPIVLNVWGSWCGPCNAEAPDLRRFAAAHPDAQVVGIDLNDTKSGARAFYRRYGWAHPSIFDPHGAIAYRLGLTGTPTTYFLDREHRIVTEIVGASTLAGFDHGLKVALSRS